MRASIPSLVALVVIAGSLAGCSRSADKGQAMGVSKLEFLTRANCKNSDTLRVELNAALAQLAIEVSPVVVDLGDLEQDDYRTGYGSPTILVNGVDMFGMPRPEPATPI